ncbi:hypothetical protein E4M02_04255 [Brevundimonas sp. S30B]|uniref:portal protein n=1 Tax=unclassified Brevundimonas TaxID=2622653 RepID=UPI001072B3D3|nr:MULTISPECIES: portal protein [unclassified Brevundimonas]QBX36915.1 hypothetical protein E4M01_03560 [Brevundimonas sp. MF30-B]TFW04290.1 hypothetical protein E4M02_04255 [Brevundimonas sp. S30B]
MKTAAARFNALLTSRNTVLDRARHASRLTIPGLVPEDGQNEHYTASQPFQSVGANGVRSLASRLLMTLFPTNIPFFRLSLDASVAEALMQGGEFDKNQADATMAQYAQSAANLMEDINARPILAEALKHLVIAGNVLLWFPVEGPPRIYRIDQYVLKRNSVGQPINIVVQEKVYPSTLSAEVRAVCGVQWEPGKPEEPIDIYTVVEKEGEQHKHWQEINNARVPGSEGSAPIEQSGWLALRWLAVPGSDWGRSHVTEYAADLMSLEDLNESIIRFASIASRITFLVNPNSSLSTAELAGSNSGDYLYGRADDVTSLQLDKSQDFSVMRATAENIEARVNTAFLIQQFRNAERVTAEEVRLASEELENTLGGTYSVLSAELQRAIANRLLYIAARKKMIPKLPKGIVPKVVTGLAALGAAAEVNRVRMWANDAIGIFGQQQFAAAINVPSLLNKLGVEHGVTDLKTLLKSPEQMAQEQQQAAMAQAAQSAAPGFVDAAMKAASDNPNQGTA